jgi:hypothetical protein
VLMAADGAMRLETCTSLASSYSYLPISE